MTAIQFAGLMYGGVPEKFPKLKISFLECGCGWLPYWVERMDEEYERRAPEAPLLKAKPSEYLKEGNWFCSTEPDEHELPHVIEQLFWAEAQDVTLIKANAVAGSDHGFDHVVTTQAIAMDEKPAEAVKAKPDSSLVASVPLNRSECVRRLKTRKRT